MSLFLARKYYWRNFVLTFSNATVLMDWSRITPMRAVISEIIRWSTLSKTIRDVQRHCERLTMTGWVLQNRELLVNEIRHVESQSIHQDRRSGACRNCIIRFTTVSCLNYEKCSCTRNLHYDYAWLIDFSSACSRYEIINLRNTRTID